MVGLTLCALLFTLSYALPLYADNKSKELWIDGGTGLSVGGTGAQNSDIDIALFVRYRINRWEIHGGGWHSSEDDVSNATVGGGYVFAVSRGLNLTGGLAIAEESANIGTRGRFYIAGRYDFKCWSIGYVHYSNGMSTFNHDRGPNEGVNLIVGAHKLRC